MTDSLHDLDLVHWSRQQTEALRTAAREYSNAPIDWEYVAEEIEGLGASERRALASYVRTVLEHLLKLHASSAEMPRQGWTRSIVRARTDIEAVLETSPSLRRELPDIIGRELVRARRLVAHDLASHKEKLPPDFWTLVYDEAQVMGPPGPLEPVSE
ncbi:MAG TPA: DUF29 domain-containing protein [Acetobacteraceae bacterium]